jgi:hypothetical protein
MLGFQKALPKKVFIKLMFIVQVCLLSIFLLEQSDDFNDEDDYEEPVRRTSKKIE